MNNYQNCLFSICNIIFQPSQNINIKTNKIFELDNYAKPYQMHLIHHKTQKLHLCLFLGVIFYRKTMFL